MVADALFGVLVYLVMNFVVLPLSDLPFDFKYPPLALPKGFVSHALLVGLPIALALRRFDPRPPAGLSGAPAGARF